MSSAPQFDILGLGAVAVDDLLYVDEYPPVDGKVRVHRRERQCGGNIGTGLVAAARLGSRCAYAGVLGDDELSRFVMDSFIREGIDLTYRVDRPDARPFHSTVIVERCANTRTIFGSLDGVAGADPTRPDAELISSASVLLVDYHGVEGILRATRIAREAGVGVVADIERDPGGPFAELLALVDHLIVPERFARQATGVNDPARATEALWSDDRAAVVVTCGPAGCWYLGEPSQEGPRHYPAPAIDVVDTTGCGDVFHGAYAAALADGNDLHQRVAIASATAALKATKPGGQAGCPTRRAVEQFLAEQGH